MPLRLSTTDPDFEAKFAALLTMKRESSADVDQAVRGILADVRTRGDAALIELSQKFDCHRPWQNWPARDCGRSRSRRGSVLEGNARCALLRTRSHRGPSSASPAAKRDLHGRDRRRARPPLDGGGVGRPVRAGRPRVLSELRSHERRPGQGRRRATLRHRRAFAAGRAEPARAGGSEAGGRRRNLSHRRRAEHRGARLRHGDHQVRRQDRRPRQRLRRRGQAAGVRHRRHRQHRRSVGSARHRRQGQRSANGSRPTFWPRPSTTRRHNRS